MGCCGCVLASYLLLLLLLPMVVSLVVGSLRLSTSIQKILAHTCISAETIPGVSLLRRNYRSVIRAHRDELHSKVAWSHSLLRRC